MPKNLLTLALIMITVLPLLLSGCGSGANIDDYLSYTPTTDILDDLQEDEVDLDNALNGMLLVGAETEAAAETVPASGGVITVNEAGSPINGLKLEVPAGSFTGDTDFAISYYDIDTQTFGDYCEPVSPLISVEGAAEYAEEIMQVTVPVAVPEGQFAMGFIYDEDNGTLQGMNTIAEDTDSITLGVRHFCTFFISAIDENLLEQDIDSGYRPGTDDWQFVNNGSFIAPGGQCAGMSVSSLWYYLTRPDGRSASLYGRYDNNGSQPATPQFQEDDNQAYRFTSMIQHDIKWQSFENKLWTELAGESDELTWKLFAYSMLITGEPQEVGIFSKAGGGHDMVCYRVNNHQLYIADPNYPGNPDRRIDYDTVKKTFAPYNSGANAEEIKNGNGKAYETIEYCAKTTTIAWSQIAARWQEMQAGTAGDGTFPAYRLVYRDADGKFHDLVDGFVASNKLLSMGALKVNVGDNINFRIYRDGVQLNGNAKLEYELVPGMNNIGIAVVSAVDGKDKDGNAIKIMKYVDFRYVKIIYDTLSIQQSSKEGEVGLYVDFNAVVNNAPSGAVYKWAVDGVSQPENDSIQFSYLFDTAGTHTITVKMMDKDGKQISTATASVVIKEAAAPPADYAFFDTLDITINLWGIWVNQDGDQDNNSFSWIVAYENISWSGASFTAANSFSQVSGSIAPDGTLSATITSSFSDDEGNGETRIQVYNLRFIIDRDGYNGRAQAFGPAAQSYVDVYSYAEGTTEPTYTRTLDHLTWDKEEQYYTVSVVLYHTRSTSSE